MCAKKRKKILMFVLIFLFGLLLAACGGDGATLTYRVDGSVEQARITYIDVSGSMQDETVDLPWETSFEFDGDFDFEIVAINEKPDGDVGCAILMNEEEIGDGESSAYIKCSGSVSKSGNSSSYDFNSFPVESYISNADDEIEAGNLEAALAETEKALALVPSYAEPYFVQGLVYDQMEDWEQALAAYSNAVERNPNHKGAFNNRGLSYNKLGDTELAIADWTLALDIDPEYVTAYYNRAGSYYDLGDYESAKADVLKVQEFSDDPEKLSWAEGALTQIEATLATTSSVEDEQAAQPTEEPQPTAEVTLTGSELPINAGIVFASNITGNFEIYSMNLDGTDLVQLTNDTAEDGDPELSPDGSKIVFYSARNGNNDIYLMDLDGGNLLQLTDDPGNDQMPTWSPNSDVIAYVSEQSGNADIFMINSDGTQLTQFTDWPSNEWHPTWNPSEPQLAFVSDQGGDPEIFILASDGTTIQLTDNNYYDSDPDWSPNGRFIVFSADPAGGNNTNLFIIKPDGTGLQQVTDVPGFDLEPTWSPDSSYLLFTSNMADGNVDIYLLEEDGTFYRITSTESMESVPSWGLLE